MLRTNMLLATIVFVGCTDAHTLPDASDSSDSSERTDVGSGTLGDESTTEGDTHGTTGTIGADAPAPKRRTFCDDHLDAVLCSDFDPPAQLVGWALWVTERGAGVLVQSDQAHSRTASVESRIDDLEELRVARIFQSTQVDTSLLRVSFAIRVAGECFDEPAAVEIAEIGITPTTRPSALRFILDPDALSVSGPFTHGPVTTGSPFASELWHEIELELDAAAGVVSITIDGIAVADRLAAPLPAEMERLQLHFGARRQAYERGSCTVHVDDVVVTI